MPARTVLAVLVLALSACTSTVPGVGDIPEQDTALTNLLLSEEDVPTGYTEGDPRLADRPESDAPRCEETLFALGDGGPPPPATQARTAFHRGLEIQIVHSVHRYPGPADAVLAEHTAVLRDCARFTLTYLDGMRLVETVEITGADPWTADISADAGSLVLHQRLVAIPRGELLSVLSVAGPDRPDPALVDALADRAAELLSR